MKIIKNMLAARRERQAKAYRYQALLNEGWSYVEAARLLRARGREVPAKWVARQDEIATSLAKGDY